jgi:hypothetical protein
MNRSQLFASPHPGLNPSSLYLMAKSCFEGFTRQAKGLLFLEGSYKEKRKA